MKKHTYLKFAVMLLASGLLGGALGYCLFQAELASTLSRGLQGLGGWLGAASPYLLAAALLLPAAGFFQYRSGCRWAARAKEENREELCARADKAWCWALILGNVGQGLNFLFFGFSLGQPQVSRLLAGMLPFLANMALVITLQHLTIRAVQELNPEKRGNVFDTRFQKDWYGSCDEAERGLIGQAAYRSMCFMQKLYLAVFVLLAFLGLSGLAGPLAFLLWGGPWLAQSISYQAASLQLEHGKKHPSKSGLDPL